MNFEFHLLMSPANWFYVKHLNFQIHDSKFAVLFLRFPKVLVLMEKFVLERLSDMKGRVRGGFSFDLLINHVPTRPLAKKPEIPQILECVFQIFRMRILDKILSVSDSAFQFD